MGIEVFASAPEELIRLGLKKKKKEIKTLYLARIRSVDTARATSLALHASRGVWLVGIKQRLVQTLGSFAEIIQHFFCYFRINL